MCLRTGGKLVYERQGLVGRHLGSCYVREVSFGLYVKFSKWLPGGLLAWTVGWTCGWSGKEGTRKQAPQLRTGRLNLISVVGAHKSSQVP